MSLKPKEAAETIEQLLNDMRLGKYPTVDAADLEGEFAPIADAINNLSADLKELQDFALEMANGNLDKEPPARGNYLASAAKRLHSQLSHISWQASQIAKGDYSQSIDFMGDFSVAFNTMIRQLSEREARLKSMHERMMNAFDSMYDLVIITAGDGEMLFCNQAARESIYNNKRRRRDNMRSALFDGIKNAVSRGEGECEFFDEVEGKWYLIKTSRLQWNDDENAFINSCTDITLRRKRENELRQAIDTDFLTGVLSRNAGMKRLEEVLDSLEEGEGVCVGLIDIDSLKSINDNFGHTEGDRAITALARILRKTMRTTDIVCRLSGDEFFVALKGCQMEEVEGIIQRARLKVDRYNKAHDNGYGLGFSCGFHIASGNDTATKALTLADERMYEEKRRKHNLLDRKTGLI